MGLYSQWEYTDERAASVLLFWALLLVGGGSLPGGDLTYYSLWGVQN